MVTGARENGGRKPFLYFSIESCAEGFTYAPPGAETEEHTGSGVRKARSTHTRTQMHTHALHFKPCFMVRQNNERAHLSQSRHRMSHITFYRYFISLYTFLSFYSGRDRERNTVCHMFLAASASLMGPELFHDKVIFDLATPDRPWPGGGSS